MARVLCERAGCRREATHRPRVRAWAVGFARGSHPPLVCVLDLPLCLVHVAELEPEIRARLRRAIEDVVAAAGKRAPAWRSAIFDGVPLEQGMPGG